LRRKIEAAGRWVLHEIDTQEVLRRDGHIIGVARQILFFYPRLMVRLLEADRTALLEAPLKFAVMSLPDNDVALNWSAPVQDFARYGNTALAGLGTEFAVSCERIAAAAMNSSTS